MRVIVLLVAMLALGCELTPEERAELGWRMQGLSQQLNNQQQQSQQMHRGFSSGVACFPGSILPLARVGCYNQCINGYVSEICD